LCLNYEDAINENSRESCNSNSELIVLDGMEKVVAKSIVRKD